MAGGKMKLLLDESIDPDEGLIACLEEISSIPDVYRVVGMVDLHLKKRTENPSSVAVATREKIIPKLSSVAQNCGMCLVSTNLVREDLTEDDLDGFFRRLRTEDDEVMRHPGMSMEDMRRVVCLGASAVLEGFGLPDSFLGNIEHHGTIGEPELLPWKAIKRLVPQLSLDRGRHGFGVIPAGNHFLEIQYIDDIIDADECEKYGLREGGITLMIHSDGGLISDDIGNLYGNRTTATGYVKLLYDLRKTALHLRDARSPGNWREKRKYYFGKDKYVKVDPGIYEGRRYLEARRLSMNAGYASRLTTIGRLKKLIESAFASKSPELRLLCDFSHNSIFRETVDGRPMWVHRHNACRVRPGQIVFLPGYSYTSSYICIGAGGAENFLNTMDHGAGKTIDMFRNKGLIGKLANGQVTRSYCNESIEPEIVPHWSDEGIQKVIDVLERNKIIKSIARLRPVAGYRYIWKGRLTRFRERLTAH